MIELPNKTRRSWLRSFWLVVSATIGLTVAVPLAVFVSAEWFGIGVLAALIIAVPGLLWPKVVDKPYRSWNRLALYYARVASLYVKLISFHFVIVMARRSESGLILGDPGDTMSGWQPREPLALAAYKSLHDVVKTQGFHKKGWIPTYLSWAMGTRQLHAVLLLPYIMLLRALAGDGHTDATPSPDMDIYTLF